MKEIEKYLQAKIPDNETCILALSGGPDSMCLLSLLEKAKRKVICVHINHHTRENNEKEYQFVKEYTAKRNIPLEYYKISEYTKGRFTEEEARKIRYEKIFEIAKRNHVKYILTAHHADDLVETIFMRILRGSSLEGYAGLKKESIWNDKVILRPLLSKKKKEIYEYLDQNHIPYVKDESNNDDKYLRNRIRHQILPIIENENPNYPSKFLQFSQTLQEKNKIIIETIEEKKNQVEEQEKIYIEKFLKLSKLTQKAYVEEYLKRIYQEKIDRVTNKHISLFLQNVYSKNPNITLNFPDKYIFLKRNGYVWLEKEQKNQTYCIKCEGTTILPNEDVIKRLDSYESKSNYEIHLNSKELALPLYITTRKPGMKMETKNLNGHQKVNDILINSKIKGSEKDKIPILIDSNGTVLWLLGLKKSKYDLDKNENYDIIYKYIKRKEKC